MTTVSVKVAPHDVRHHAGRPSPDGWVNKNHSGITPISSLLNGLSLLAMKFFHRRLCRGKRPTGDWIGGTPIC